MNYDLFFNVKTNNCNYPLILPISDKHLGKDDPLEDEETLEKPVSISS